MKRWMGLWRAEWIKTRHHLFFMAIPVGLCTTIGLYIGGCTGMNLFLDPGGLCAETLPFPASYQNAIEIARTTTVPLALVVSAMLIGGEYSRDTWKAIAPRQNKRWPFIVIKCLMAWVWLSLSSLMACLLFILLGQLATHLLEIPSHAPLTRADWGEGLQVFIEMAYYCTLGTLLSVLTQSTSRGMIAALILPIMMLGLASNIDGLAWLMPTAYFRATLAHLTLSPAAIESAQRLFNDLPSPFFTALALGTATGLQLLIACQIFQYRDLTSHAND